MYLHNNSNDFDQASAGGINVRSSLSYSSLEARGGTEQIAASPSTTHLTSLGYTWLELLGRLMM